jgi:beta-lactamase class A
MRKLFTILIYTLVILLIGRNLPFLPRFAVLSDPASIATDIKRDTEKTIAGKKGNYGVYFADLTHDRTFGINEKEMFKAASVNKVPIVATFYSLENKGKLDFDKQITLQERDIQDYGTGSLRYQKPGATYSLKTLAKLALKQSDNTAAHILGEYIGRDVIQGYMEELGLRQTSIEENTTSPYDMYLLFKKIYENKITSEGKTQELLGFMTETDIEDRLPAKLPESVIVHHKTGDAVGALHDVGIIMYEDRPYFLGVMTSDIGNQETVTRETIAEIAKHITDYRDARR